MKIWMVFKRHEWFRGEPCDLGVKVCYSVEQAKAWIAAQTSGEYYYQEGRKS